MEKKYFKLSKLGITFTFATWNWDLEGTLYKNQEMVKINHAQDAQYI